MAASPFGGGGGDRSCYGAPMAGHSENFADASPAELMRIAAACADAAKIDSVSVRQSASARFNAGLAQLELSQKSRDLPAGYGLPAAIEHLDMAVRSTSYSAAPSDSRRGRGAADLDLGARARLALARAYRLNNNFEQAIRTLDAMINAAPGRVNAAARLELAEVYFERGGRGASNDGSLEAAVDALSIFTSDLKEENDDPTVRAARAELIKLGNALGDKLLSGSPSNDAIARAVSAYTKAQDAAAAPGSGVSAADVANIQVNIGNAKLRRAGLPMMIGSGDAFDCGAAADNLWLEDARKSFEMALAKSPSAEANVGAGCARQAMAGRDKELLNNAIPYFRSAVSARKDVLAYRLSLARALSAVDRDAEAQGEFKAALALAQDGPAQARIYVDIAKIYLSDAENGAGVNDAQIAAAADNARAALAADNGNGPAHLMFGRALFEQRAGSAQIAKAAMRQLNEAVEIMRKSAVERTFYADALFYRSQLQMESANFSPGGAIGDAVAAVNLVPRPDYREQACLAYVTFLEGGNVASGKLNCEAQPSSSASVSAHGLLLEGMFYVASARVPGYPHDRAYESAFKTFERGLAALSDANDTALRAKLGVGRAISYICVGMRDSGRQMMTEVQPANLAQDAYAYFSKYRVTGCTKGINLQ